MLGTNKAAPKSRFPWLIFAAGCLCPVVAYFVDAPGALAFVSIGLTFLGFCMCLYAPWHNESDDFTTQILLSLGSAAVYFLIIVALLWTSLAVDGLPQD